MGILKPHKNPALTNLSRLSFFLDFLLRLTIRLLQLFLLAGPVLMDVFSNGVVVIETLFPLYKKKWGAIKGKIWEHTGSEVGKHVRKQIKIHKDIHTRAFHV